MFKHAVRYVAALSLAVGSMAVCAQESPWRFVAGLGYGSGGETITSGTITTVGTNQVVPFQIKPGSEYQLRVGGEYRLSERLAVQTTLGYSDVAPMGFNGSLNFTTVPVELLGMFSLDKQWRVGAGIRKSYAEMKGSGVASDSPVLGVYETSLGSVLELQYLLSSASQGSRSTSSSQFGFSLRFVNEDYKRNGYSFGGNHYELGIVLFH